MTLPQTRGGVQEGGHSDSSLPDSKLSQRVGYVGTASFCGFIKALQQGGFPENKDFLPPLPSILDEMLRFIATY